MTALTLDNQNPLPADRVRELAESGVFDEIANSPGSIQRFLRGHRRTHKGVTDSAIFFAIYQTGRYGPQNSFRMCLVHQGFDVENGDYGNAEEKIEQGMMEWLVLGERPEPIRDPEDEEWVGEEDRETVKEEENTRQYLEGLIERKEEGKTWS